MKLLLITLEFPPIVGGISTYLSELYSPRLGHDVEVISPATHQFYRWWIWPRWLPLYWKIKEQIRVQLPQQIHVSHVLPIGHMAYWFKKTFGVPYVLILHGTDLQAAHAQPRKWKRAERIIHAAHKIVVNSEATKKLYRELLPRGPEPIVILPGAPAAPQPAPAAIEEIKTRYALHGQRVIFFIARLVERKGVFVALRAMEQLLREHVDATLVIAGDGPVRLAAEKLSTELKLYNRVRFIGRISDDEKWCWYSLAHVFWFPAQPIAHEWEGFGITSLEAQSCGCPVVVSAIGGLPESLSDTKSGFAVDPTPEAFTEVTKYILNNAAVWQQMRGDARHFAAQHTWSASQDAFRAVIES